MFDRHASFAETYPSIIDGKDILFNSSPDKLIRLRELTLVDLGDLLVRFRQEQAAWLKVFLETPRSELDNRGTSESHPNLIYGLSGSFQEDPYSSAREQKWTLYFIKLRSGAGKRAAEYLGQFKPLDGNRQSTAVHSMSVDEQRIYLRLLIGDSYDAMSKVLVGAVGRNFLGIELEDELRNSSSADAFLDRLLAEMLERALAKGRSRREGTAESMFLAFLNRERVLLLPYTSIAIRWNAFNTGLQICFPEIFLAHIEKVKVSTRVEERTCFKFEDLFRAMRGLKLASTMERPEDINDVLCQRYKDLLPHTNYLGWAVNTYYDTTIRSFGIASTRRTESLRRPGNRRIHTGPFDWVKTNQAFGIRKSQVVEIRPEMVYWADFFEELLPLLEVKRLAKFQQSATDFLRYLLELEVIPPSFEALDRHVHFHEKSGSAPTYRNYLAKKYSGSTNKNGPNIRLQALEKMFSLHIWHNQLPLANPIDLSVNRFKVASRRGKSVRSALDKEMLEVIREFNARDDFAFSKTFDKHYRNVLNPDTGTYEDIWFPAYAIALDSLLELPFRSSDIRFLDTGEGDRDVYDPVSRQMVPNVRRTATKGRQQGALQLMPVAITQETSTLGIFINCNKTSELVKQGRLIPWCSPELETRWLRMMSWAQKYVPISEPVKAMSSSYLDQFANEQVTELIPDTYPMFRDPQRRDGQPLSRELLFDYWTQICKAVEEECNEGRAPEKRIFLTYTANRAQGPALAPIFDIHALRVSGVTAMVERGMPPDLIQEVVGHASLCMTLYYYKVNAQKLHGSLQEYYVGRQLDAERIRQMPFDELASITFNLRPPEDAVGLEMLRERVAINDPSWKLLSHGICPGGDCGSGGEFIKSVHQPLRPGACSLCRFRLSGPPFLAGQVANANLILFEMRRLGEEIGRLQRERYRLEDKGSSFVSCEGQLELARRRFDDYAAEWAAEIQYIHASVEMRNKASEEAASGESGSGLPTLFTAEGGERLIARLEQKHELHLLRSIAAGAEFLSGFTPGAREAIKDMDEFLNLVLDAQGYGGMIMRLPRELRLESSNVLAELITTFVPDEKLDSLADGGETLDEAAPYLRILFDQARTQLAATGNLDLRAAIAATGGSPKHLLGVEGAFLSEELQVAE